MIIWRTENTLKKKKTNRKRKIKYIPKIFEKAQTITAGFGLGGGVNFRCASTVLVPLTVVGWVWIRRDPLLDSLNRALARTIRVDNGSCRVKFLLVNESISFKQIVPCKIVQGTGQKIAIWTRPICKGVDIFTIFITSSINMSYRIILELIR